MEQKNGSLVRRFAGYHRFDTPTLLAWRQTLYSDLNPYANLFLPVMKLVGRAEVNGTRKLYDRPQTPLARLLASGAAHPLRVQDPVHAYLTRSPLTIKRHIDRHIAALPGAEQGGRGGRAGELPRLLNHRSVVRQNRI